jgi:hypothetical protein
LSAAGALLSHASVPRAHWTAPLRHSTTAAALVVVSSAASGESHSRQRHRRTVRHASA